MKAAGINYECPDIVGSVQACSKEDQVYGRLGLQGTLCDLFLCVKPNSFVQGDSVFTLKDHQRPYTEAPTRTHLLILKHVLCIIDLM
ncbi:hypothetical protein MKW98_032485 [Papaver atlanticum]|uniref:Uncharacterized protein n=1 Tax=Papaver atlanticum TaxID=357466 RepID=A0AAD4SVS2_9MAGN|nr:hypothetical protein MKW98_032485 [Papaver atlanticum]